MAPNFFFFLSNALHTFAQERAGIKRRGKWEICFFNTITQTFPNILPLLVCIKSFFEREIEIDR